MKLGTPRIIEELFLLQRASTAHYLNAGSYGAAYKLAADVQKWYQQMFEHEPVRFNAMIGPRALQAAKECVADYIGASHLDIVPLANATTAVNTVLSSTELRQGDLLLMTSISYPAVRSAVARWAARSRAGVVEVLLGLSTLQKGADAIIASFKATLLHCGSRIKLAVLDHIVSAPTVHLPIPELAAICHQHGIPVLVDGAHALGAIPLDVPGLGVDFYTSNLHKWGCAPKSAAFLWVKPCHQAGVRPLVTSHGYETGFQGEFAWQGTSDISAWLAVPTALGIQKAFGVARVRQHNHEMLCEAVSLLLTSWGRHLVVLGSDAASSHMASIELPELQDYAVDSAQPAERLHSHLEGCCGIQVPITSWESKLWVRISAQIFNVIQDYEALRDAISGLTRN